MNLFQPIQLGNPEKYQNIFANRKVEIIAGVIVSVFLLFFAFAAHHWFTSPSIESQLRVIYAEREDARIQKSNSLAQKQASEIAISQWEVTKTEAEATIAQVDQRLVELLQAEVRLGENRATTISTALLTQ